MNPKYGSNLPISPICNLNPLGLDNKGCFFIFPDFMRVCGLLILNFKLDMKNKKTQNENRKQKIFTIRTRVSNLISDPKGLVY